MRINEVVHKVGLSRKSIRYYESVGLLSPSRDVKNDYRDYSSFDVQRLKVIKFLRDLGVPIKDLKLLNDDKISLQECLMDRIRKIEDEEEMFHQVKKMCLDIIQTDASYHSLDIDNYFAFMNQLSKEGFLMRNVKVNHVKKIFGAVVSSLLFLSFFLFLAIMIIYFQFTETDKLPFLVFIAIMIILVFPILSIVINLIHRIKEIKGGEEDEASFY